MTRKTRPNTEPLDDLRAELTQLRAQVTALELWRTHQSDLIDSLLNAPDDPTDHHNEDSAELQILHRDNQIADRLAELAPPAGSGPADLDRLTEWVHEHVCAVIARPLRGEIKWCPRWWDHPEAVFRLDALRNAWLELSREPGAAMSIWIRDHLDPCLRELAHPVGPFADCSHSERRRITDARTPHQPVPTLPTLDRPQA